MYDKPQATPEAQADSNAQEGPGFNSSAKPFVPAPSSKPGQKSPAASKTQQQSPVPKTPLDYYEVLGAPTNTLATDMYTPWDRKDQKTLTEKAPEDADAEHQLRLLKKAYDILLNAEKKLRYDMCRLNGTAFVPLTTAELDTLEEARQARAQRESAAMPRADDIKKMKGNWMLTLMAARTLALEPTKLEQPNKPWPAS